MASSSTMAKVMPALFGISFRRSLSISEPVQRRFRFARQPSVGGAGGNSPKLLSRVWGADLLQNMQSPQAAEGFRRQHRIQRPGEELLQAAVHLERRAFFQRVAQR